MMDVKMTIRKVPFGWHMTVFTLGARARCQVRFLADYQSAHLFPQYPMPKFTLGVRARVQGARSSPQVYFHFLLDQRGG